MKTRFIFTITIVLSMCVITKAQDVIFTRNSQVIESKISEVSTSGIKYHELDNMDGPLFVLSNSEIDSIRYSNGKVVRFTEVKPDSSVKVSQEEPFQYVEYVCYTNGSYFHNNEMMNDKEYAEFLSKHCQAAYDTFNKGRKLKSYGWTFFGLGLTLDVVSSIALISLYVDEKNGKVVDTSTRNTMIGLAVVGACFEIACIPTLIVGYHKMHNSAEVYNLQCYKNEQPRAYWSINASGKGIGLAYNF